MPFIEIREEDYDVLKRWASVSRTLTESIRLLDILRANRAAEDDLQIYVNSNQEELHDLLRALDNVNAACKEHFHRTQE